MTELHKPDPDVRSSRSVSNQKLSVKGRSNTSINSFVNDGKKTGIMPLIQLLVSLVATIEVV